MSMSIRCDGCGLEYSGGQGMRGIIPSLRTLARPRYLAMLLEIKRFHREATAVLHTESVPHRESGGDGETLAEFLDRNTFSRYFASHFMAPLVSAVWSCDPGTALKYPARYLFEFLNHHGMLSVTGSPVWRTVTGGSKEYVRRVAGHIDEIHTDTPVRAVYRHSSSRNGSGIDIRDGKDDLRSFDAAVVAVHPQQALKMLAEPTAVEHRVLGSMPYSTNHTQLHTDESVLPRTPRARASWNYRIPACGAEPESVLVSYDMTRLQRLGGSTRFLVTLGGSSVVDSSTVLDEMTYEHPQYTPESLAAQRRLPELNTDTLAFAGAYHGWGFHEDGAKSGHEAAERIGGRWT